MILTAPRLKRVICLTVICFTLTTVFSQVRTTVLSEHNSMEDFVPLYGYKDKEVQVPVVNVLPVDLVAAREHDRRNGINLSRYGVKADVDYSKSDGSVTILGNSAIWELSFNFPAPSKARFLIKNLELPSGAALYLYSEDSKTVVGPIINKNINRRKYYSDLLRGKRIHLKAIVPVEEFEDFRLTIEAIIHAQDKVELRGFGDSFDCHIDIVCRGAGWQIEKNSVCLIFLGNTTFSASGALINNSCEDFTPYILTAFHAADQDNPKGGNLSASEIDEVEDDWTYRFYYESPNCTPVTEPMSWLTFQGATVRAAWERSDFLLLELDDDIIGYPDMTVAGWDRSSSAPDDCATIHHPAADVKKFTMDGGTAIVDPSPPVGDYGHTSGDVLTVTLTSAYNGDVGETEGGTSGAPWFNDDQRIIGQHLGAEDGDEDCDNTGSGFEKYIGRFFTSWSGNGSDATRLSTWLAPNTSPTTLDSRRVPYIEGDDHLCSPSTEFTLENSIPLRSVSWSVSPTIRFTGSTSGTGTSAELTGSSVHRGEATITFTISGASGCDDIIVEKEIWVGTPISDLTITGVAPYGAVDAVFTGSGEDANNDYKWYVDGSLAKTTSVVNAFQIPGGGCGNHLLAVTVENVCGTSTSPSEPNHYYNISCFQSTNDSKRAVAFPNPGNDQVQIALQTNNVDQEYHQDELATVIVIDQLGRRCKILSLPTDNINIDTSDLPKGVYFVQVTVGDDEYTERILIEK